MDRLRRMEIFVTIVESGQFTNAAHTLGLSKSSVSHALSDLEKYLGLQLISRNNRVWQLTDSGKSYYERCKTILYDVADMEDKVREESQTLTGHIRLSAPYALGTDLITPILAEFMELYPDIIIDMKMTERVVDLVEERVDIAFRAGVMKDSSLVARLLGETEMIVCASPEYLKQFGAPKDHSDIKNHKCLMYSRSPYWSLSKNGKKYKITPQMYLLTNNGVTYRDFAVRGKGIGYISKTLSREVIESGKLVHILQDYKGEKIPFYAVRTGGSHVPARVATLLNFIVDQAQLMQR